MAMIKIGRSVGYGLIYGVGLFAGVYSLCTAATWLRFGRIRRAAGAERDSLLDRFMPTFDIVERHHVGVAAPAETTFAAAGNVDLEGSWVARTIIRAREIVLGSTQEGSNRPRALLANVRALGWTVLAERPGREIVMGAVTRPWDANVVFKPIAPEAFAAFNDPDYVKIAWTLRADPVNEVASVFRTETRAVATDQTARAKFRRYWSMFSPGIVLIRRAILRQVKCAAERSIDAIRESRRQDLRS